VHTSFKPGEPLGSTLGMVDPRPWDKLIYARRHHVENLFSRLKDWGRIAFRRDQTPERTMAALASKLPQQYWIEINERLVPFGKHVCTGPRPRCPTVNRRGSLALTHF